LTGPPISVTDSATAIASPPIAAVNAFWTWATKPETLTAASKIITIVLAAILIRAIFNRMVDRIAERIVAGVPAFARKGWDHFESRLPTTANRRLASPLLSERRQQRARTTASVMKSATTLIVTVTGGLTILQLLGVPVAPLLAGASIVGVSLGFGAQSLVKDVISGIFMIVEDQYGVGDAVDLGQVTGNVEAVGLRVTRIRGDDGTIWYLRNGEILRVGNHSQGWSRAVVDVQVALDQDLGAAEHALRELAAELTDDPDFGPDVIEELDLLGIETLTADGVVLRVAAKTAPTKQAVVARELRRRIKARFDAEGIRLASAPASVRPAASEILGP
jgi:small conductance mechanosensitive channel